MPLKITAICHDTPYPPTHGGKLDMWNSLKILDAASVDIQLISWDYDALSKERAEKIANITSSHEFICLKRSFLFRLRCITMLLRYPWFAGLRWPGSNLLVQLTVAVKKFGPDILLLEGWHGALLALYLHDELDIPIIYRSQNIEYLYMKNQVLHARGLRAQVVNHIGQWHMKNFERYIMSVAHKTYAISYDDLSFFKENNYGEVDVLLPFVDTQIDATDINTSPQFDLSFLGNLHAANNIDGIHWLLNEVMPIVWKSTPETSLIIAGSSPNDDLYRTIDAYKNVTLIANPKNAAYTLSSGRIYINPTLSAGGIQLKNIEMALHGRPMIARSKSLTGVPEPIKELFTIADSPEAFANAILIELDQYPDTKNNSELLAKHFGSESIMKIINDVKNLHE
jgi:hypothetical protein